MVKVALAVKPQNLVQLRFFEILAYSNFWDTGPVHDLF